MDNWDILFEKRQSIPFSEHYVSEDNEKKKEIAEKYSAETANLYLLLDDAYEDLRQCLVIVMVDFPEGSYQGAAAGVISNNLEYLMTAIKLTNMGRYSQARALYRNVYEALVLMKYISLSGNMELLQRLQHDVRVSLKKEVYSKVIFDKEETDILARLWNELCEYSHFSVGSLTFIDISDELQIQANYDLARILLYMNYHVLNSHCYNGNMKAMADRGSRLYDDMSLREMRMKCRSDYQNARRQLSLFGKQVVRLFVSKWKLKGALAEKDD